VYCMANESKQDSCDDHTQVHNTSTCNVPTDMTQRSAMDQSSMQEGCSACLVFFNRRGKLMLSRFFISRRELFQFISKIKPKTIQLRSTATTRGVYPNNSSPQTNQLRWAGLGHQHAPLNSNQNSQLYLVGLGHRHKPQLKIPLKT
jgi:hypothetical protein